MKTDCSDVVNEIFDAFGEVKLAYELLPPLSPHLKPVYISVLNIMHRNSSGCTRVSDINRALGFALPNTTRLVKEMVSLGIVEKIPVDSDKRAVSLQLTGLGENYTRQYVVGFHRRLEREFFRIPGSDRATMVITIRKILLAMQAVCRDGSTGKEA